MKILESITAYGLRIVKPSQVSLGTEISRGKYSVFHEATLEGSPVGVKRLKTRKEYAADGETNDETRRTYPFSIGWELLVQKLAYEATVGAEPFFLIEGQSVKGIGMEVLRGETLEKRCMKRGNLPTKDEMTETYDAIEKMLRAGIWHPDLHAGNIIFTKDGAKIIDFGEARLITPAPEAMYKARQQIWDDIKDLTRYL